jgi:nucleotide-binding universal stress UspA family protein
MQGEGRERPRVVVGMSGSPASLAALREALTIALDRGWSVEVVTAWPDAADVFVHEVPGHYCLPRGEALHSQRAALERMGVSGSQEDTVTTCLVNDRPADALLTKAEGAALLVIGSSAPVPGTERPTAESLMVAYLTCPLLVVDAGHRVTEGCALASAGSGAHGW